ncbi:DUF11 domain-containing protein [Planosporangium mesophilum]|uniref:DUF11 domain-containing protein n=1 Tax=Planosporangium mesophilum TaxID=689768 RepID=A0A8J3TEE3_9ACTN|nr:DUF11 domain-containing protein [Planosporangium mesophilum]NJC82330.1 hypothetical protein [Planosporangium mesophilum]GII24928.1 hypothetical protein Pme01_45250 [Planosporangium mesophilum]
MTPSRGRRALTWLGACAGAALVIAGASPTAAQAAAAPAPRLYFPNLILPGDSTGKAQSVQLANHGDADLVLQDTVVSIDTSGLAGVASVAPNPYPYDAGTTCTTAATSITCSMGDLIFKAGNGGMGLFDLTFTPVRSAQPDQKGDVTITLTARDQAPLVKTSAVTIAESVNLSSGPGATVQTTPGGRLTLPATVRNSGTATVHRAVFDVSLPWDAFTYTKRYSNCGYADQRAVCHFTDDLLPGGEYTLSEPMGLATRSNTPAPRSFGAYLHWETETDAQDWLNEQFPPGTLTPGTEGELHLVAKPTATGTPGTGAQAQASTQTQTDTDSSDNLSFATIDVTGTNRPDVAATGTSVTGAVGTTVNVTVGITNLGPARLGLTEGAAAEVRVTVPKGTTVVSVPAHCWPSNGQDNPLGAAEYLCYTPLPVIDVSGTYTWTLGLRIDSPGETSATFTVETGVDEANKSNNTAKIIINPAAQARAGDASNARPTGSVPGPTAPPLRATIPSRLR